MITERPWGNYEILSTTETSQVKRITVKPGQRLSLQTHERRSEYWVIESGLGQVQIEKEIHEAKPTSAFIIDEGMSHRVTNIGNEILVFIEIQLGTYFGEDDIIRLEDDYGRN